MNESTVNSLIDRKTQLIGDMMKAKITERSKICAVLNPQQKTEWQNKMKQMNGKWISKFKNYQEE
jgi:protein CpxP